MEKNRFISFIQRKVFRIARHKWNHQYSQGTWDGLLGITELPRTSVLVGYILHLNQNGSLLDIGCGHGLIAAMLGKGRYASYTGIDIAEAVFERGPVRRDENTRLLVADMNTYVPDRFFDFIVFNESLYYSGNPPKTITRYGTYLNEQGYILISLFDKEKYAPLWRYIQDYFTVLAKTAVTNRTGTWRIAVLQPIQE